MATTLDKLMDLSPDVVDYKDAMAARGRTETKSATQERHPDLQAIREVNSKMNGHSAWQLGFPDRLVYTEWIRPEDLRHLNYEQMRFLRQMLEDEKTAEITFERFERAVLLDS